MDMLSRVNHTGRVIAMTLFAGDASHLEPTVAKEMQQASKAELSTYVKLRYLRDAAVVVQHARHAFPGWTPLIFHDASLSLSALKALRRAGAALVDMRDSLIDDPRLWRFLAADDVSVEAYMIRDIDSQFLAREVCAVREWIASGFNFHVMRDHPGHFYPMMAGMWGGRRRIRGLTQLLRQSKRSFYTYSNDELGSNSLPSHFSLRCLPSIP